MLGTLEKAQQSLLDSELKDSPTALSHACSGAQRDSLSSAEQVLNGLSASLEPPRLLALADRRWCRRKPLRSIHLVLDSRDTVDEQLDGVMEGWRLTRLPRIDRDILRLAVVDLGAMKTPLHGLQRSLLSLPIATAMNRVVA